MDTIKKYGWFLASFFFLLASLLILETAKTSLPKEHYGVMLDAARRMEAATTAIREERLARGISISPMEDINQTGLIGDSYTEITTTLGSLEAKRSATNPNTAAMIVDMLVQCGVHSGDTVAVNLSSSFPGLNLAVLCALDAVNARGVVITSVGASTYGGNLPDFTWLDMEQVLLRQSLISNHSQWFSLGGAGDLGREMPREVKEEITARLLSHGLTFLCHESLEENLKERVQIYCGISPFGSSSFGSSASGSSSPGTSSPSASSPSASSPVCFINAGGNLLSFGGGSEMVSSDNGILRPSLPTLPALSLFKKGETLFSAGKDEDSQVEGLIPFFLGEGIPVIHLLNMKELLPACGLPYDPSPLPAPGEGGVYEEWHYPPLLAAILLGFSCLLLWQAIRRTPCRRLPL